MLSYQSPVGSKTPLYAKSACASELTSAQSVTQSALAFCEVSDQPASHGSRFHSWVAVVPPVVTRPFAVSHEEAVYRPVIRMLQQSYISFQPRS